MQHNLDDIGGARELALHRINVAKDDLEAAEMNFEEGITDHQTTEHIMLSSGQFQHVLHWSLKHISSMLR